MASPDTANMETVARLVEAGQAVEAAALLETAIARGDANAALTLAQWRLSGEYIRRDLGLARDLFGKAAALGNREAEPIHTALLANGAGGSGRRWSEALRSLQQRSARDRAAATQLALLQAMDIDETGDPVGMPSSEQLSADPEIRRFRAFLSPAECSYLIACAQAMLQPSMIVHPITRRLVQDPIRTSTAAGFPFVLENSVLHAINRRIAAASRTSYEQGEPTQVLSYQPGQQYKLHSDALPSAHNQRVLTFLVSLNDVYEGGETIFPDLQLTYKGAVGDALMFCNVDQTGRPHPRCRHAGCPVISGRKLLLSKWIRAQALDLSGPPGRPL